MQQSTTNTQPNRSPLKVKTHVKAGGIKPNHNQTIAQNKFTEAEGIRRGFSRVLSESEIHGSHHNGLLEPLSAWTETTDHRFFRNNQKENHS